MSYFKRTPLTILVFTIFLDLLGFGILIPIVPQLLANPLSKEFLLPAGMSVNQGYIILGFLTAVFPIGIFFAAPILGQLSDRYGRKRLLAVSIAGTSLSYVVFAMGVLTKNIPLLFVARAFDGITGGNIAIAQASIADVTKPEDRAKNFGLIGAAFGLGFIIGPYIGGKLSDPSVVSWFNAATPFWFTAILSALNVLSLLLFLPETHETRNHALIIRWGKSLHNIMHAFSLEALRPLFITGLFFQGGFAFFITFFGVFLIKRFGFTQSNIGDYFAYVGLWIALTQGIITRLVARRFHERRVLRVSIAVTGIGILLFFFPTHWWMLLFITPVFAVANGLSQANLVGLVSKSASPAIQGEVLGINASVQSLAQSIPPLLGGFVAAEITPESPVVISSMIIIFAGLLFLWLQRPQRAHA